MSEEEPRRPWGVRGQAITCHFDFNGDGNESVANESVGGLSRTVQLTDKTTSSLAYSNTKSDYFTAAYQHHHSEKEHQNRTHSLPHLTCVTNNLSDMKDTESNSSSTNRYSTITISNNYTDDNVDDRYSSASYSEQQQPLPQSEYKKPSTSLAWRSFAKEKSNFRDNDLMNDEFTGKERFNEDMQVVKYPLVTVRNSRSERVTFNLDGDKNEYDEVGRQDDAHRKNKISMDDGMEKINDRCMPKSCKGILINRSNHDYVKGLQHNELFQSDTVLVDNSRMRSASTQSLNNDGNYNETNNSNQNLRSRIYFPRCMSSNRNEVRAKYINHDLLTNEPKQAVDNHHYHDHFSVNTPQKHLVGQIKRSLSTSELLLTRQHFTLNNKSNDYKSLTNSTVFSPLTYRNKVSYHVNDKYFTSFSSSLSSTRSLSPVNRHNQFEQMAFNLIDTNDKDHFNSNDNNTDLSKTISCRPNSLCSSSVLPQSIPPSLSPMLTAPSGVSVHSSHLSLHCIEMIRKSSDLPVIPRKHKATSDSHLNCFNKQILCNHQKLHQSNSHHRCYHFSYVNESTHSVNSSECTSLNKIVSVQPIQRLCNWKYPLITEQKWIALEPLSNSTCLHLNEQQKLISLLMELPQLYQELISRYINAINDTIDLSVCCWTKSSQMDRLGKLVEKMKTYLRPPWFFCRLCQDDLTETVHSYLISNVSHLLEKHQEIQKQFEKLYNLLQSENTRDTFIQLFSNMFTNVIEFVKYSYSSAEIMCANLSMLKKNEVLLPAILDRSCCFQYLLKCILSGLDLTNDINNHDDNSDVPIKPAICNEPAALKNQLCEFLANMLASFPNDELLTSINQFNPENCKQIIRLYKQLSHKSLDASEVPIDMVINILNIFANHVWESDSTSYIAYLPLPALDKDINDQLDTINYCAHLTVSLHHLVLNDNVNDDGKLC
ncbi:unnamed protein product [Schistosoma rodhaini]|nr:unnamed protein product [Schistosoma rodhaini]